MIYSSLIEVLFFPTFLYVIVFQCNAVSCLVVDFLQYKKSIGSVFCIICLKIIVN